MTDPQPQSHCHMCGKRYVAFSVDSEWPKHCPKDEPHNGCGNMQWFNPKPIGVLIQPVSDGDRIGVLTPIRGGNPMRGHPALTGGFHEGWDQSSEDAGARELMEEIRLARVSEDDIELLCSRSTGPFIAERRQNLVFGVNPQPVPLKLFDNWQPDDETLAIDISWAPRVLAFPSHTYAMAKYFQRYQGIQVPQSYLQQPRTGERIDRNGLMTTVFNVPYVQPDVDRGVWHVEFEDRGIPIPVRHTDGKWIAA